MSPSLAAYLAMLAPLTSAIDEVASDRVALTYRGRALAPTTGIPCRSLVAALAWQPAPAASSADEGAWSMDFSDLDESTGDILAGAAAARHKHPAPARAHSADEVAEDDDLHPLGVLIAAQLRLIDTLSIAGFRFQGLSPALLEALARDEALLARAGSGLASLTGEVTRDESLRRELEHAIEDLGAMMRRAGWHSTALETADESQAAYEPYQLERDRRARLAAARAAEGPKSGPRKEAPAARKPPAKKEAAAAERNPRASAASPRTEGKDGSRDSKALPPWALVAGAAFTVLMVAGIVALSSGRHREPPPSSVDSVDVRNELGRVAPGVDVRDATVKDKVLNVVVASEWMNRSPAQRQADVEAMTLAATALNFDTVRYVTTDGVERASYRGGVFTVVGVEHAAPGTAAEP